MTTARFWWPKDPAQTDPDNSMNELDVGLVTDADPVPVRSATQTRGVYGHTNTNIFGAGWSVRVVIDTGNDDVLFHRLLALEDHLKRGGWCHFAADATKFWAYPITAAIDAGDDDVTRGSRLFGGLDAVTGPPEHMLSSGDWVLVQSPAPTFKREYVQIDSYDDDEFHTVHDFTTDFPAGSWMRWELFHPYMRLAIGQHERPLMKSDRRINGMWTAELIEDGGLIADLLAEE